MRGNTNLTDTDELAPLIPEPMHAKVDRDIDINVKSIQNESNTGCFNRNCPNICCLFQKCSKWTILIGIVVIIVLLLFFLGSFLPFGLPFWIPHLNYNKNDPHIILIISDDIGWSDLGYSDYSEYQTRNIDDLVNNGIKLKRSYVHLHGSATRASILTGIYGYKMGLQNGINTGSTAHLPDGIKTVAEMLRDVRYYATYYVGKWNLGYSKSEYTPTQKGFDSFIGFHQRFIDYWHYSAISGGDVGNTFVGYDLWNNTDPYELKISDAVYATEMFQSILFHACILYIYMDQKQYIILQYIVK